MARETCGHRGRKETRREQGSQVGSVPGGVVISAVCARAVCAWGGGRGRRRAGPQPAWGGGEARGHPRPPTPSRQRAAASSSTQQARPVVAGSQGGRSAGRAAQREAGQRRRAPCWRTACSCMGRHVKEKAAMAARRRGGSRAPTLYTRSLRAGLASSCMWGVGVGVEGSVEWGMGKGRDGGRACCWVAGWRLGGGCGWVTCPTKGCTQPPATTPQPPAPATAPSHQPHRHTCHHPQPPRPPPAARPSQPPHPQAHKHVRQSEGVGPEGFGHLGARHGLPNGQVLQERRGGGPRGRRQAMRDDGGRRRAKAAGGEGRQEGVRGG